MSFRSFYTLALLFALAVPATAAPTLTAQRALELALEHSPQIEAARQRTVAARAQVVQARADQLPHLFASLGTSRQGEEGKVPVYTEFPSPIGPKLTGYSLRSFTEAYSAELGVQWLAFSSGAVQNAVASRRAAMRGVEAQGTRVRQTVEHAVLTCWYDLQRARAKLAVAQELLDLARNHLGQVETFYKHGAVAKHDVLRTRVSVADGELVVLQVENGVELGWKALERLVGLPLEGRYDLPDPTLGAPVPLPAKATSQRPELVALGELKTASLAAAEAARGSLGPKLIATAGLVAEGRSFWPTDRQDWQLGLALRWDFADGGLAAGQAHEARAKAAEADAQVADLKRQIDMEVAQAELNMTSAASRAVVARRQEGSAAEDYRIALVRYDAAVGTNLDVLDARAQLSKARNGVVDACYDMLSARNDYWFAVGEDPLAAAPLRKGGTGAQEGGNRHVQSHR